MPNKKSDEKKSHIGNPKFPFLILTTMEWPDEEPSKRIVNWNNQAAVRSFARVSTACLAKGGRVITERAPEDEIKDHQHDDRED